MTDFQNWWDGYFHEINGQKETAQAAWQARGELDAVRIKDLTALVVQQDKDNNNYAKEIIELTAKLDKAKEALSMASWNNIGGYEGQQRWLELNKELNK